MNKNNLYFYFSLALVLLLCEPTIAKPNLYPLSMDIKVNNSTDRDISNYQTFMVITQPEDDLLSTKTSSKPTGKKLFVRRYYDLGTTSQQHNKSIDIRSGKYSIHFFLKADNQSCKVANLRPQGECFLTEKDIYCPGSEINIDEKGAIKGTQELTCEVPDEL